MTALELRLWREGGLSARLGIYREAYYDLIECVHNAVKAGDWIVDGACDPEKHLSNYKPKHKEF
jgi:hypothetical protein